MGTAGRKSRGARERDSLSSALFTATQERLLGLVLGQPGRSFTLRELIRLAGSGSGAVQREVDRLGHAGIFLVGRDRGTKTVRANESSPIYLELRGIVDKTAGVPAHLRRALESARSRLQLAILYGSLAKGTDTSSSDIDVLLVSDDLTQEEAFALFQDTEMRLGRRISPTIYTRREFAERLRDRSHFLTKVLSGKHVVLIGEHP